MDKRFWYFLILVNLFYSSYGQQIKSATGIKWETELSWEQILKKAKEENKFIFIDCYATWCVPCKKMDKEVYTNDSLGKYFADLFISVRVQMDSTKNDDNRIRNWLRVANYLTNKFQIQGYPTLLFLTPDEKLLNKELGFRDPKQLVEIAATTPKKINLYAEVDKFKKGIRHYDSMMELAKFVKNVIEDNQLSLIIANDYIHHLDTQQLLRKDIIIFIRDIKQDRSLSNKLALKYKSDYLDMLDSNLLCTRENLFFAISFPSIVRSSDYLFKVCYFKPHIADSMFGSKGTAKDLVYRTITMEELFEKLIEEGKPITIGNPDWEAFKNSIAKKYQNVNSDILMLDFQINYYQFYDKNWQKWALFKNERIKKFPPEASDGVEISLELNDGGAWYVFRRCNEKSVLKKALAWIDLAIELGKKNIPKSFPYAYFDTKANLLYKLGNIKQAIQTEELAISFAFQAERQASTISDKSGHLEKVEQYRKIIKKMKSGEPTYLEQGAVWDYNMLPKGDRDIKPDKS